MKRNTQALQEIMGRMRSAMERYEMVRAGDRIAVGVSGGKDSLTLLYALAKLRDYYPEPFELTALTADPCFGGRETDYSAVEKLCEKLEVPYVLKRTRLGEIIFEERREPSPCSLCSRMRRGILHKMAKEQGCGSIALGHHADDAVQTFLMNLFYGGRIACFSPKTYLPRRDLTLIRPMIFCTESGIASAALQSRLPVVISRCPAEGNTGRRKAADLIRSLEKDHPGLKAGILGAMQRSEISGW